MIRVGVIGAGRIGQVHARALAHHIESARLAAVTDVRPQAARALAHETGAEAAGSAQAIFADPTVEAVVIASSTDTHSALIEEAARAGKHVFCEKPIDHDLGRIDRALAAVDEAGVQLQIGFNRRFDAPFAALRAAIVAGDVGDVQILRITSRDPSPPPAEYVAVSGGIFLDMTIHDFDMVRFLTGAEVERVYATGAVLVEPAIGEAGDVDTAVVVMELSSGAIATIDNSRKAVYGYDQRVEVFGSGGMRLADNNSPDTSFFMDRYADSYVAELEAFVEAVAAGSPVPVTGADGRAPVVIGLAAQRSMIEGRPIRL